MQSVQINLFDLFYEVAEKFAQRLSLNTSSEHAELGLLKQAYYGSIAIDYSSPIRKYVYLKTYAPRHALIWRTYMRLKKPWTMDGRTGWRFNSIGTGPAAEVIGVLESGDWADKSPKVEVACLENEESWYGIGEIVSELYTAKSRRPLQLFYTKSTLDLFRSCFVFGSMVVSDLARQGVVDKVIESIGEAVRPAEGLFLDATNYTLASGATPFVSDQLASIRGRFVNFKQESIDEKMQSEMDSELTTMSHSATFELDTGFGMNAIPVQF